MKYSRNLTYSLGYADDYTITRHLTSIRKLIGRPLSVAVVVAIWVPAVSFGIRVLWQYDSTPGRSANAGEFWPASAPIQRVPNKPSLLMFVHPLCPCSDASVAELSVFKARTGNKTDIRVFFYIPRAAAGPEWNRGGLWDRAAAIPGVHCSADHNGQIAKAFGVYTSGEALLFASDGKLLFTGGITASRGHQGDNAGLGSIIALVNDNRNRAGALPISVKVFGCSLRTE